jgi:hypothetical protein
LSHGELITIDYPGTFYLPGYGTNPIAINDNNLIGGSYTSEGSPIYHAFIYKDGHYTTFDAPNAAVYGTQINGLNNKGIAAGPYSDADGRTHGFILRGDHFTTVDYPGAAHSEINSINDRGDIVGDWYSEDGTIAHGYIGKRIK